MGIIAVTNLAHAKEKFQPVEIIITAPDDWHYHFRDDDRLPVTTAYVAQSFKRAVAMPNLKPPVTTTEQALIYREQILKNVPKGYDFEPLMTLYLTDNTTPAEVARAKASGKIVAFKYYPAGATTNSDAGVTDIKKVIPTLKAMADHGMLLLIHSEVADQNTDVFDRERVFINNILKPLIKEVPNLKIVLEHITTKEAVEFVVAAPDNVAATITAHHLLYNRNAIFKGGIRPHMYCLPVLKREQHRAALLEAIRSGNKKFFLGTDSAAHVKSTKEASCGCAGVFSAVSSLELYAEAFEEADAMQHFEAFASFNGPDFYGLPRNTTKVRLIKQDWTMPEHIVVTDKDVLIPLRAGETVKWKRVT
ncbi:MAG TPA: dihydroorotase [Gammaproteobacteria bacterium]|nr:dihydroorotase [Gammaproteobacteria bacterium]